MDSKRLLLVLGFLWNAYFAQAQTTEELINSTIERLVEDTESEVDIQELSDALQKYVQRPLNLNKASSDEIFACLFLSASQKTDIISHKRKFGDFLTLQELQVLPSFDLQRLKNILPFVTLGNALKEPLTISRILKRNEQELFTLGQIHTPFSKGYTIPESDGRTRYIGSPLYNNVRYRFTFGNQIKMGFVAEKDAGEPFGGKYNPMGYDFYSFHFGIKNVGIIKGLYLGDYHASFGQGLTLSTGLAFGKSSYISNSKRNYGGFDVSRSLRENAYLRGAALDLKLHENITLGVFLSSKSTAASGISATDSVVNEELEVSTVQEEGGSHRTLTEIRAKKAIFDRQAGMHLTYQKWGFTLGTVHTMRSFGATIKPQPNDYNQFNFTGTNYFKNGIYYDYVISNLNFFGEVSHASFENKIASVNGLLMGIGKQSSISLLHRNYPTGFINYQSTGFGESANTQNEQGLFMGFETSPAKHWRITGFYDMFSSPWRKFRVDAPSQGYDYWAELHYKPNKVWTVYFRHRKKIASRNLSEGQVSTVGKTELMRNRIHLNYKITKYLELRTRAEWSSFVENNVKTYGSLLYQDIVYKPFGKWQFSGRIAQSNMDDYDNRIFAFENVPLYQYPLYAHSYSGIRSYLLVRYRPIKKLDIWFRYAIAQHDYQPTSLIPEPTIGSGLEEIQGIAKRTFTLQLRYKIK